MSPAEHNSQSQAEIGLSTMVEAALTAVAEALRRRPDLAQALARLLGANVPAPMQATAGYLSLAKYAAYRSVSERTIRYDVVKMEEGTHYHRIGQKGGRVVVNVAAADAWYAERGRSFASSSSIEQLAVDEVTRRRARVALKKRKEK